MHSWRLFSRCAVLSLAVALVATAFVLSGSHDRKTAVGASNQALSRPPATALPQAEKASPTPAPPQADNAAPPQSNIAAPVVKSQQTLVPAVSRSKPAGKNVVAELPDTSTKNFGMVGVTWAASTKQTNFAVTVRTKVNGAWTAWQHLDLDDTSAGGRPGTEPLWVGTADGVAVKVLSSTGATPKDIKVMTIDPGQSGSDAQPASTTVTSAAYQTNGLIDGTARATQTSDGSPTYTPQPAIILRAAWGARRPTQCNSPIAGDSTHGVVVHHTAGNNSYTKVDSAKIVRADQAYHMDGHGWCDIGYNFVVDKYGQIFEGRSGGIDRQIRAAHSGNTEVNTYAMGVSMSGNFDKVEPSPALKDAMVRLIGWRMGTNYLKAKGTYYVGVTLTAQDRTGPHTMNMIAGHRNVVSDDCPGAAAYAWISYPGGLRDRVESYIANYSSPIKTLAQDLGPTATGPLNIGEAPVAGGRRTQFTRLDMYSSDATGAHTVKGALRTEYNRLGGPDGSLGFPKGEYKATTKREVGVQRFANGSIFNVISSSTILTAGMYGPIATRYAELKEEAGPLGWPTSSINQLSTGVLRADFTGGFIELKPDASRAVAYSTAGQVLTGGTPGSVPAVVKDISVIPSTSSAVVSWSAASGASTYTLCLVPTATSTSCALTYAGLTGTSRTVTGLTPKNGTDWFVRVYAYNARGHSTSALQGFDLIAATSASNSKTVPSSRNISLIGHGFGHGIGMGQYGAQGAAIKGLPYDAIVKYYYPGTSFGSKAGDIRVLITRNTTPVLVVRNRSGIVFRNIASNKTLALPTKVNGASVSAWRIVPIDATRGRLSALQYKSTAWATYLNTTWTGDGQFEAAGNPLTLIFPDGSMAGYRTALRSAVPSPGSADRSILNVTSIDNYVRGVVAAEMPSSWRTEALKAQSVAARTYGVRSMDSSRYYDICDTTSCQVYGGASRETATTNAAVAATSGRILTFGGTPAFTQFSASSGGWTAAGSFPYLKAKEDVYDNFSGNSVHTWTMTVKASSLEKKYPTIGTLKSLKITKRTGGGDWGGRVSSVTLTGSKGTKTVTGNDMRFVLGLRSNWFAFN